MDCLKTLENNSNHLKSLETLESCFFGGNVGKIKENLICNKNWWMNIFVKSKTVKYFKLFPSSAPEIVCKFMQIKIKFKLNCDEKKPIIDKRLSIVLRLMAVILVIFDYLDISRANWYPARGQQQNCRKYIHSKYSTITRKLEPLETFEEQIGVSTALSFQSFININSQK